MARANAGKKYKAVVELFRDRKIPVGTAYQDESGAIVLDLQTLPVMESHWNGTIRLIPENE